MRARKAKVEDAPELNRLLFSLMSRFEKMDPFDAQDRRYWKKKNTAAIRKAIRARDKEFIVVEEDGEIAGLIEVAISKREGIFRVKSNGHIETMFIRPDHRGKGYGRMLIGAAMEWFRSKNAKYVTLGAHALDDKANSFWQKMGFKIYNIKYRKKV